MLTVNVIPVEVRAGTSGSLKSLQVFLAEKERNFAVRLNMDRPPLGSFTTAGGTRALCGTYPTRFCQCRCTWPANSTACCTNISIGDRACMTSPSGLQDTEDGT